MSQECGAISLDLQGVLERAVAFQFLFDRTFGQGLNRIELADASIPQSHNRSKVFAVGAEQGAQTAEADKQLLCELQGINATCTRAKNKC